KKVWIRADGNATPIANFCRSMHSHKFKLGGCIKYWQLNSFISLAASVGSCNVDRRIRNVDASSVMKELVGPSVIA
ncbi:unnamed protein product, partial [Dovyalis caffra]